MEINRVYLGDCRTFLPLIDSNSVDLVVTDPPYRVISGGNSSQLSKRHSSSIVTSKNDGKIFTYNSIQIDEWIGDVYRILKPNSHCYIGVNTLNITNFLTQCQKYFKLHNILVWEKNNCTPNRWYMKNAEYFLFLYKGKSKPIRYMGSKTVHQFRNPVCKTHPTEKPIDLMRFYIENSSSIGDLVCDPFMGSGSVAKACIQSNRNFGYSDLLVCRKS